MMVKSEGSVSSAQWRCAADAGDLYGIRLRCLPERIAVEDLVGQFHMSGEAVEVADRGVGCRSARPDSRPWCGSRHSTGRASPACGSLPGCRRGGRLRGRRRRGRRRSGRRPGCLPPILTLRSGLRSEHLELARSGRDHVHDQVAIEADAIGAFCHICAMRLHDGAGLRQHVVHADFFEVVSDAS